ncbi:hypothetical protein D0962_15325 [Leptolyngbyaceae cyanobacterium CCMR0082]|uniref:Uncharacterized protein n=1 Tax=Adonisia turfae CCMR0082 TaxID=2304604 RepID=A0A6M0S6S6_9CYAN|nr:competence protein ComJ [Adonisia turfae]NEZ64144.1 hypothetical protein [Adonisia turfae CCMR0082]
MQLIEDKFFYAAHTRHVMVVHPSGPYGDMPNEGYHARDVQGFAWYPNCVTFDLANGDSWLTVYHSQKLEIQPETTRAILVPFNVPGDGYIEITGNFDVTRLDIPTGQYQLLFELRLLTKDEIFTTEKYSNFRPQQADKDFLEPPELCTLTFTPTAERVEPKLLRFTPWHIPREFRKQVEKGLISLESLVPETLIMFDELLEDKLY